MAVVSSCREVLGQVPQRAQPLYLVASTQRWELQIDCLRKQRGRRGRRQVIMALTPRATHVLQWLVQRVATQQQDANLQSQSQFGLGSATRPYEAGIASNRVSAMTR
ncbi:hypothetical protein FGO68_gene16113 [Halteria grandinella]|uniref:Uncharacterized protein n=1 Tax=Halteria grandinella TaxID=5974 RepID=A0A8J8NBD8_HALGN|nr:hypothetical protein FGO68_gene16113 [Halteria grandinella]